MDKLKSSEPKFASIPSENEIKQEILKELQEKDTEMNLS